MASAVVRNSLGLVASWTFAAVCFGGSIVYFNEVRAATSWLLGLPPQDQVSAIETPATANSQSRQVETASRPRQGTVELQADRSGHFSARAEINGRTVEVMVDTGATIVAFTYEDAERAGIFVRPADFTHSVQTANGRAKVAPVTIDSISIGDITVRNVRAAVSEPGKLTTTLLGMTFLGRLSRAELRRDKLIMEE